MTSKSTTKPHNGRRSFIWKAGAALSAGLAATVPGMAKTNDQQSKVDQLARQVTRLQDENAIRELHRTYEDLLDSGNYSEIAGLFTDNAEVIFNGGIYKGNSGVNRLYRGHFGAGMTGKRMQPVTGVQIDAEQQQDVIELAEDGKSAKARFPYSIRAGAPLDDDSVLVQMARLHGEGIKQWREAGVYNITYAKDPRDGSWKIARLEHRVLARAEGSTLAKPVTVAPFSKVYPEEPAGPDKLVTS